MPVSAVIPARDRLFGARSPFAAPGRHGRRCDDRPRLEPGSRSSGSRATSRDAMAGRSVAGCRLRHGRCRRPGRRAGAPGRVLHVHGRADPVAIRDPDADAATTGPEHPDDTVWSSRSPGRHPADAGSMPMASTEVRLPAAGEDWLEAPEAPRPAHRRASADSPAASSMESSPSVHGGRKPGRFDRAVRPIGRPPAPSKPTDRPRQRGSPRVAMPRTRRGRLRLRVAADGGATWTAKRSVDGGRPTVEIGGLTNGTDCRRRAFAGNDGVGDVTAVGCDPRRSGLVGCNPMLLVPSAVVVLLAGRAVHLLRRMAGRAVYVTAQVDQFAPSGSAAGRRSAWRSCDAANRTASRG